MSSLERKLWWICATAAYISYGVAGFAVGQGYGRKQQKRWSDAWYAEHPLIKPVSLQYMTLDTCLAGMQGVAEFSEDGTQIYIQCGVTPPPKPASSWQDEFDKEQAEFDKQVAELNKQSDDIGKIYGLCWSEEKKNWLPCKPAPRKAEKP